MTIIVGADIGKTGLGDSAQRRLTDNGGCDAAVSGTIVFERAATDAIVGHYDLRLKSGDAVSGPFKAIRGHERHMCW
jgi:hypothetical protein